MIAPDLAGLDAPPDDEAGRRLERILEATSRYALGRPFVPPTGTGELDVRPPAAVALGLAAASVTGVAGADAAARASAIVGALAGSHVTARPDGWGRGWQTPLWAAYVGLAAWLIGSGDSVAALVADEADAVVAAGPAYFRDRAGTVLTPGDTKAEEDSWRGRVVHLAATMLGPSAARPRRVEGGLAMLIASYSRPADVGSGELVHGRTLSAWLGGSNVDDTGLLVNHGRFHPDYMAVPHHAAAGLHAGLAGTAVWRGALLGLDRVFAALVDHRFPSPPFEAPGGTILRPDGGVYYPQGSTWGVRRRIHLLLNDVQARTLGFDWLASTPAAEWERLHGEEVLAMIARSPDGRVYVGEEEFTSPQREEEALERAGQAYLAHQLARRAPVRRTNAPPEEL